MVQKMLLGKKLPEFPLFDPWGQGSFKGEHFDTGLAQFEEDSIENTGPEGI